MMRKHPDVIVKGKTIELSDLDADPIATFKKSKLPGRSRERSDDLSPSVFIVKMTSITVK